MYLPGLLSLLTLTHAGPAAQTGCWSAPVAVRVTGEPTARPRVVSLIFSDRRNYAHALLIKDGAREFVTDFDCTEDPPAACTLLDDGGAFHFARLGVKAQAEFGAALAVDARESVRFARITNDGFAQKVGLSPLPACAKEQARVRALFDAADR